jgi:apolipoprotein N-acyltransferase
VNATLHNLVYASGWRGIVLTYLLGAASALAMPPTDFWWLWFITVPFFLFRFGNVTTLKEAFREGWLFGFGYFCVALHWIGYAFLVDAKNFLWMMPFAVGGLAAVMAVYWGLATTVTFVLSRFKFQPWLSFPLMLAVAEWLRGHLMTGFPWAVPGLSADGMGPVVQLASMVGMTGLTLLVLSWSAASVAFISRGNRTDRIIALGIVVTLPLAFAWGWQREHRAPVSFVSGVMVRLVQPNLSQDDKWRTDNASQIFDGLVAASIAPGRNGEKITHVIWPESAVPFLIDESDGARKVLRTALGDGKILVTGAIRRAKRAPTSDHFTSALVFDRDATVTGVYDKWRLVPGGEFLPFEWVLAPLGFQQLVLLPGGFSAGTGPKSLAVGNAGRAGIIICYEAIFPDRLLDSVNRPTWIINITNDGWFGASTGPYQHLAQARMRAIEQGLPLARSANTGISAMIDPMGRVLDRLALEQTGFIDAGLPQPVPPPLYAHWGDDMFLVLTLAIAFLQLVSRANCQDS